MGNRRFFGAIAAAIAAVIAAVALDRFARMVGATELETRQALPGDDIIADPHDQSTHAVTIRGSAANIWPWLIQAGYHRGGWYTDNTLDRIQYKVLWERIAPDGERPIWKPSADRILPEFQGLRVGDIVPDGPPGTAYFNVVAMEPERFLVLHSTTHVRRLAPGSLQGTKLAPEGEFTWVFVLAQQSDPGRTRLILRTRAKYEPAYFRILGRFLFTIGELLFPMDTLKGIKRRVESYGKGEAVALSTGDS